VGLAVAHPDDETLWAGGMLLLHPGWRCRIMALCRASDADRAPKFRAVLARLGAEGEIADLDDGPEQSPLPVEAVKEAVAGLAGDRVYDLFFTHAPWGEYTRHLRHEETARAVIALWQDGALRARRLCLFAYDDGGRAYLPRAREDAHRRLALPPDVWEEKYRIIHQLYGFAPESWEARATPRVEGFWCFDDPDALDKWLVNGCIATG
jgi:LmbE family N-acetylglucosaminyl deacetylase